MQQQPSLAQFAPTILLVEDDAAIQDVLSSILRHEGCDVIAAETGQQALEAAEHQPIDLVVLDVMLPDLSGYEVCSRLRERKGDALPIVMLTALGTREHVVSGLQRGADDYVVKPFDPQELQLRIGSLLRRSKQATEAEQSLAQLADQLDGTQARADAAEVDAAIERTLRHETLHNVTTHMQSLSRVADVAVRRFPAGPLREVVDQLRQRIRGAALMYEISASLQNEPVDAGQLIQTIARALKDVYRPWRRVIVEVSGPELYVPAATASPLALIINELVTNAMRHAFPEMRYGTVRVEYRQQDNSLVFAINDNGVGFQADKPASGRGRQAVETLVAELGGNIRWTSSDKGTRVEGNFPLGLAQMS